MKHLRYLVLVVIYCILPAFLFFFGFETWIEHQKEERIGTFYKTASPALMDARDIINQGTARLDLCEEISDQIAALPLVNEESVISLRNFWIEKYPGMIELTFFSVKKVSDKPWDNAKCMIIKGGPTKFRYIYNEFANFLLRDYFHKKNGNSKLPHYKLSDSKKKLIQQNFIGKNRSPSHLADRRRDLVDISTRAGERGFFWDVITSKENNGETQCRGLLMIQINPDKFKNYYGDERIISMIKERVNLPGFEMGIFRKNTRETILKEFSDLNLVPFLHNPPDLSVLDYRNETELSSFLKLRVGDEQILFAKRSLHSIFPEEKEYRLVFNLIFYILIIAFILISFPISYGMVDIFISLRFQIASLFLLASLLPLSAIVYGGVEYLKANRINLRESVYSRLQVEAMRADERGRSYLSELRRSSNQILHSQVAKDLVDGTGEVKQRIQNFEKALNTIDGSTDFEDFFVFSSTGEVLSTGGQKGADLESMMLGSMSRMIVAYNNTGSIDSKQSEVKNGEAAIQSQMVNKLILGQDGDFNEGIVKKRGLIHKFRIFNLNLNLFVEPLLDKNKKAIFVLTLTFVMQDRYERVMELFAKEERSQADRAGIQLVFFPLPPIRHEKMENWFQEHPGLRTLARRIAREKEAKRAELIVDGKKMHVFGTQLKVMDQYIVMTMYPESLIEEEILVKRDWFLMVIILSVLILILVSFALSRRFLDPVRKVQLGVHAIAEGDLAVRMNIHSNDELGELSATFNNMVSGLQEKERMSRYVSDFVREEVKKDDSARDVIGETMKATILFSDIRGFTTMSESNPPLEIVGMLNDYLEVMTLVIQEHGGVIDKFIGDAIMAVFYPDDSGRSDEERALVASLDMRDALQKFNKKRVEEGKFEIDNGIGLNTGNVIKGSIGSRKHRVDLTVIGDNVNVAARLESLSKEGKYTKIIISEETLNQVRELIVVEPLEIQNVKGKIRTVKMYEVVRRI